MEQLDLLTAVVVEEKPWKRTTTTSRQAIRLVEASGLVAHRRALVLKTVRHYWNRHQVSPTADELARFLFRRGLLPGDHPDYVKPRLTELSTGWYTYRKGEGGVRARVHHGGGLLEKAGKRVSRRSGLRVSTWRAIEIGTGGPR